MEVCCFKCNSLYNIKRKTCADSKLRCRSCKQKQRLDRFASKHGTTHARYYYSPRRKAIARKWILKNKFNMSLVDYDEMLKAQNNVCAICKEPNTDKRNKNFCIDHDHKTGNVRGLLCRKCNMVLGLVNDDIDILQAFIGYLAMWRN